MEKEFEEDHDICNYCTTVIVALDKFTLTGDLEDLKELYDSLDQNPVDILYRDDKILLGTRNHVVGARDWLGTLILISHNVVTTAPYNKDLV